MSAAGDGAQLRAVGSATEPLYDEVEGVVQHGDLRWGLVWRLREKEEELKAAERDLRSKRALITKLQRKRIDEDESARQRNAHRDFIIALSDRWREGTGHKRSKLTPERFDMAADRLEEGYSEEDLRMATEGLIADAWTDEKGVLHDDWKVAMKNGEAVERYANKCPREKREEIRGTLFEVLA